MMSVSIPFGVDVINRSSYSVATDSFIGRMYRPMRESSYSFPVEYFELKFKFSPDTKNILSVAATRFPGKVVFGSKPELDLVLVNTANSMAISRSIPVNIDWSKVETPQYTASVSDTNKKPEKIVYGSVQLYTSNAYAAHLTDSEKEKELPSYFLDKSEYLQTLKHVLNLTSKKLFMRSVIKKRSGLTVADSTEDKSPIPSGGEVKNGWTLHQDGLTTRPSSVKDVPFVYSMQELEAIVGGYILAPVEMNFQFEVIAPGP